MNDVELQSATVVLLCLDGARLRLLSDAGDLYKVIMRYEYFDRAIERLQPGCFIDINEPGKSQREMKVAVAPSRWREGELLLVLRAWHSP
ncbi:hypothetical protein VCH24_65390 [Variovorax boronicumulans]|nr:hypothetical protein VCH24_65390 [Variovorax boronicumulans]